MHLRYLQCWWVLFLILFLTHILYVITRMFVYASSAAFSSSSSFYRSFPRPFKKNGHQFITKRTTQMFIPWWVFFFFNGVCLLEAFLFVWDTLMLFFHFRLLDGVCFQYPEVLASFLSSERPVSLVTWQFYFFRILSFHTLFSMALIFLCQIPFLYTCCISLLLVSVSNSSDIGVRQWPGRPGFNSRSSHAKDSKNGTWFYTA